MHPKFVRVLRFPLPAVLGAALLVSFRGGAADAAPPLGQPGTRATYRVEPVAPQAVSVCSELTLRLGTGGPGARGPAQWLELRATKEKGQPFSVWLLTSTFPPPAVEEGFAEASPAVSRYVVQEAGQPPQEFVHRVTGAPVLPTLGAREHLWPRPGPGQGAFRDGVVAPEVVWLGHTYRLAATGRDVPGSGPPTPHRLELLPDVLVGVPSNARTTHDVRRYDGSDYEMVRLTRDDYAGMIRAGLNCFRVDAEQAGWLRDEPVFFWGIGGGDVPFPECLFRSTYLGPVLFLDEPGVGTRDHVLRPRLAREPEFRRTLTPEVALEAFTNHFHEAVHGGGPVAFLRGLRGLPGVDLGTMDFPQRNLFSWETTVASAAWQLTAEPDGGPRALVFEPPGRLGSRRTLPEMNLAYGCQLSPEDPGHLAGIIYGFLRGAARAAGKDWGVSIYGAVDRADAPWLLTHAYDLGATHFFFWDNYQLACVPPGEYLALARHLQAHVQSHPERDRHRLNHRAGLAILLPPGYDLGHTHMGRGNLWGLGELNLERRNRHGVRHREVMAAFFTEIEHALRLGVAFDLLWDLDSLKLDGYREVVRVRADARVEILGAGGRTLREGPRIPVRPEGVAPGLALEIEGGAGGGPRSLTARARVTEGDAPVYYTTGTDARGLYPNVRVLWELYGPGEEDYRLLTATRVDPAGTRPGPGCVETRFTLEQPGRYRLRAATPDLAGRSTVVWQELHVGRD